MRYDVELPIVSSLTQHGVNIFTDKILSSENLLDRVQFDKYVLDTIKYKNIDTQLAGFNNTSTLNKDFIASGVKQDSQITLNRIIETESCAIPVIDENTILFNSDELVISDNTFVDNFTITENGYFVYDITNFNYTSISIITLSSSYSSGVRVNRNYSFTAYKNKSKNTNTDFALLENLKATFRSSTNRYQYTIVSNETTQKIYLNTLENNLFSENLELSKHQSSSKIFYFPEFPLLNDNNFNIFGIDYANTVKEITKISDTAKGGMLFLNNPETGNVSVCGTVSPLIILHRYTDREKVHLSNIDISYKSLNFKNGLISLVQKFGVHRLPQSINISSDKSILQNSDITKLRVNLADQFGIPVKDKDISITINKGNASFPSISGNKTITVKTSSSGTAETLLRNKTSAVFVQKEWVKIENGKTKISFPKKLGVLNKSTTANTDNIFTYFVFRDNLLLTSEYINTFFPNTVIEKYEIDGDISSYRINGRKIAFVNIADQGTKKVSKFIKPISVTELSQPKTFTYREFQAEGLSLNKPIIDSISKNIMIQGSTSVIYITGKNLLNSVVSDETGEILFTDTVASSESIRTTATVPLSAQTNSKTIKVQNEFGSDYIINGVQIIGAAPTITSCSKNNILVGSPQEIIINGTNFTNASIIFSNGKINSSIITPTKIILNVTGYVMGEGNITIFTNYGSVKQAITITTVLWNNFNWGTAPWQ